MDARSSPAVYGAIDYCFALRDRGLHVYYQPASTVVDLNAWADPASALEEHVDASFERKWRSLLKRCPVRPKVIDLNALHALAVTPA